jgi:hypothetical protein
LIQGWEILFQTPANKRWRTFFSVLQKPCLQETAILCSENDIRSLPCVMPTDLAPDEAP